MLNSSAMTPKRLPWRVPALIVFGAAVCVAAFLVSSAITRQLAPQPIASSPSAASDIAAGSVTATDRQISTLQDRLRQQPNDQRTQTQLGQAYLQRARETSDPSYYTRADGILNQALVQAPDDADTLIGLGALALARHQFQDAVD